MWLPQVFVVMVPKLGASIVAAEPLSSQSTQRGEQSVSLQPLPSQGHQSGKLRKQFKWLRNPKIRSRKGQASNVAT